MTPFACGFRSPCGVSLSPQDELFVTDNQGDWMPASPIFRVEAGGFYGHPASLDWTPEYREAKTQASLTVPPARAETDRAPAAVWLPYKWSRSPGNIVWDTTEGAFGPFADQVFVSELTNGMVLRGTFEEVDGVLQGWVLPFVTGIGSVVRVAFAPDGTLLCGLTNRGWGGLAPADGLARIRWTGETPFAIDEVQVLAREEDVRDGGFRITLTETPSTTWSGAARRNPSAAATVTQYDYDYWWEYGSPERDTKRLEVSSVEVDGRQVDLRIEGLEPGRVARVKLEGMRSVDQVPLRHEEFAYTLNVLPGAPEAPHVARIAPPPPARESDEEGWLRLTYGDATQGWEQTGWELVAAEPHPDDPTRFQVGPGNSHLTNTAVDEPSHFVSRSVFQDATIHADFTLPVDGEAVLWIHGSYGILLKDSQFDDRLTPRHCGAIVGGPGFEGIAPSLFAYQGPHQLHELDIEFRAPRFDERGQKVENARFVSIHLNDQLLHEDVELPRPSHGALQYGETDAGPIVFQGDGTQVAIGNIRVRPGGAQDGEAALPEGYRPLIDLEADEPLADWTVTEDGYWYVEDEVLLGEGPRSHLFSPRDDYEDFDLWIEAKVSDGGNSGVLLRAPFREAGWVEGYEAEINCSFADPRKTASLIGLVDVRPHLVAPDTWFRYQLSCRNEDEGTRIRVTVNDVLFVDHLDRTRSFGPGHIALQQHHDGSVIEFRRIWIRER